MKDHKSEAEDTSEKFFLIFFLFCLKKKHLLLKRRHMPRKMMAFQVSVSLKAVCTADGWQSGLMRRS